MVIEVSKEARKKLDSILEKKDPIELVKKRLRIYVSGRGWGGTTLGLVLEEPKEGEPEVEVDNYKFVIGEGLESLYQRFMIEFLDSKYRPKFVVLARKE